MIYGMKYMKKEPKWGVFCYGTMSKKQFDDSNESLECREAILESGDETSFCIYEDFNNLDNSKYLELPLGSKVWLASWGNRVQNFACKGKYYWAAET